MAAPESDARRRQAGQPEHGRAGEVDPHELQPEQESGGREERDVAGDRHHPDQRRRRGERRGDEHPGRGAGVEAARLALREVERARGACHEGRSTAAAEMVETAAMSAVAASCRKASESGAATTAVTRSAAR